MDPLDVLSARIGRSLRARRIASGMSMSELARVSGLSKTIIGRIEAGSGNPSVETLWRIAHALAIPLGSLLGEDPEPRVRVVRARRTAGGMSMSELARASGLSKTIIGRIEAGSGNPSVETLWRIAHALAVPLGSLLAEDPEPRVRVVRAQTGDRLQADSGMEAWLVHAEGREHRSELFELSLPAGTEQRTGPHMPGTREVVVCLRGHLRVGPLGEEVDLGPGDAVWFAADSPHRYVGLDDAGALNWVLYDG